MPTAWPDHTRSIQRVIAALGDELAQDLDNRRYDEIQALGSQLRGALGALVRDVRTTTDPLAAAGAVSDALAAARVVLANAGGPAVLAALDLEPDVIDLAVLDARLRVAERLQGAPVRETAKAVGVTPGYLSELGRMKKGLPSPDIAHRLDRHMAAAPGRPMLAEIVNAANAERAALADQRRGRHGGTKVAGIQIPANLRGEDRLKDIAEALRLDEPLQQAVERLLALSERERRAVAQLLKELAGA